MQTWENYTSHLLTHFLIHQQILFGSILETYSVPDLSSLPPLQPPSLT